MVPLSAQPSQLHTHLLTSSLPPSRRCDGLSGRALRKLPFQAHAFAVRKATATCDEFVVALLTAVQHEKANRAQLGLGDGMEES